VDAEALLAVSVAAVVGPAVVTAAAISAAVEGSYSPRGSRLGGSARFHAQTFLRILRLLLNPRRLTRNLGTVVDSAAAVVPVGMHRTEPDNEVDFGS
jgi:hypothetical protein